MAGDDDDLRARLEDLMRAPDFSAARANARLELHEAVCAEQAKGIRAAIDNMSIQIAAMHERMNVLSNRMWLAVVGALGLSVSGFAAVAFHLITRAK